MFRTVLRRRRRPRPGHRDGRSLPPHARHHGPALPGRRTEGHIESVADGLAMEPRSTESSTVSTDLTRIASLMEVTRSATGAGWKFSMSAPHHVISRARPSHAFPPVTDGPDKRDRVPTRTLPRDTTQGLDQIGDLQAAGDQDDRGGGREENRGRVPVGPNPGPSRSPTPRLAGEAQQHDAGRSAARSRLPVGRASRRSWSACRVRTCSQHVDRCRFDPPADSSAAERTLDDPAHSSARTII